MTQGGSADPPPDQTIHVAASERAAGLGHGRRERRRRASLAPLVFLIVGTVVVGAFAYLRSIDELSSSVEFTLNNSDSGTEIVSMVSITNDGSTEGVVLSVGANAGGPILSQDVSMGLASEEEIVGSSDQLLIPAGETALIDFAFVFDCTSDGEFAIEIVVRVQVRQKGFVRVFNKPDSDTNVQHYSCTGGAAVALEPGL